MRFLTLMLLGLAVAGCESGQDEKPKAPVTPAPAPSIEPPKDILKVLLDPSLPDWKDKAPDSFKAKFATTQGEFTIRVERAWSPLGADRFFVLVRNGYFDETRFFRVVSGFMAQFGIHGNPDVNRVWKEATIKDDPVLKSNRRGWVTYAMRGRHTRTTQLFINYADQNAGLDGQGFSPFGQVVEGMDAVDRLYSGYGDGPPRGGGPDQMRVFTEGNAYLNAEYKQLDYIKTARIIL